MKLLCFIDSLGSGGAQRQLVNLAIGLKKRKHDVQFLIYNKDDFYLPRLSENNIKVTCLYSKNYVARLFRCRKFIRENHFDAVIAFLETPSLIAEFSSVPMKSFRLIVGERSAHPRIIKTVKGRLLRFGHCLPDYVVANSHTNIQLVRKANPFLPVNKTKVIYNIYDLDALSSYCFNKRDVNDHKFHIVIAATHSYNKNFANLARAISSLNKNYKERLVIDWYGRQEAECFKDSVRLTKELDIVENIHFYPPTLEIYQKMVDADAVGLFSLVEGLSNTICEAMCLGKPVIVSDVSDNKLLIQDKKLISDPTSPNSIANSLMYLLDLSDDELHKIGLGNRKHAENLFKEENILRQYLSLLN